MIEIEELKKFQEEVNLLCEMNRCTELPVYIYLYNDERVVVREGFSLSDAIRCSNLIVLNKRNSSNLGYVNVDGVYLGMYSSDLKCIEEIELNSNWKLLNIIFSRSSGSYNKMKGSLIIQNKEGEEREIVLEKYSIWEKDFLKLFKMAYELNE